MCPKSAMQNISPQCCTSKSVRLHPITIILSHKWICNLSHKKGFVSMCFVDIISTAYCSLAVTPLLTYWSYYSLAISHRSVLKAWIWCSHHLQSCDTSAGQLWVCLGANQITLDVMGKLANQNRAYKTRTPCIIPGIYCIYSVGIL